MTSPDPVQLAREVIEKYEAKSGHVVTDGSAAATRWWMEHEPERHLVTLARTVIAQAEQIERLKAIAADLRRCILEVLPDRYCIACGRSEGDIAERGHRLDCPTKLAEG